MHMQHLSPQSHSDRIDAYIVNIVGCKWIWMSDIVAAANATYIYESK